MINENKVWIIIINYNGIYDTKECIESVLKSDYQPEILLVDNASDEDEGKIISREYTGIHVIKSEKNLGFAGGNNLGIKFAMEHGADYIMLLNNDTVIDPAMISELIKNANETDIVAPRMFYYDKKDVIWYSGGNINKYSGNIRCKYFGKNVREVNDKIEECTFATGCCILFSVNLIDKIGGLKDDYFMYCEDTEFSIRVIEAGGVIRVIPSAKLWHKVSSSIGGAGNAFSLYYSSRNRLYYIKDHEEFFFDTATIFTVMSRVARIIQYMILRNSIWKSYYKALKDYKKGVRGRQSYE